MEWWLPEAEEWEEWGDAGQRVQAFSYKIKKFWKSDVQYDDDNK